MVLVWIIQYSSSMASISTIPPEALRWLAGDQQVSILLVGASGVYASHLADAGHSVTVVDRDPRELRSIADQRPEIHIVAAHAESLPFDPCNFSTVLAIQNFHTFAPGLALSEWARVLRSQGWIGLAYLSRDDSVPWVKRLKRIVQSYLPGAMTGDHGASSVSALFESAFFPYIEEATFRMWMPSTRAQLQDSARQAVGVEDLEQSRLDAMVEEIGLLYDEYARVPDPLLLPYQIECWRAEVDQSTMMTSLIPGDDGLSISL